MRKCKRFKVYSTSCCVVTFLFSLIEKLSELTHGKQFLGMGMKGVIYHY